MRLFLSLLMGLMVITGAALASESFDEWGQVGYAAAGDMTVGTISSSSFAATFGRGSSSCTTCSASTGEVARASSCGSYGGYDNYASSASYGYDYYSNDSYDESITAWDGYDN